MHKDTFIYIKIYIYIYTDCEMIIKYIDPSNDDDDYPATDFLRCWSHQ